MKIQINWRILGGAVLSGGAALKEFGGTRITWWAGVILVFVGPCLLALRSQPIKRSSRKKPKHRKKKP